MSNQTTELAGGFKDAAALITAHANDDRPGLSRMLARMTADELRSAIVGILGSFEDASRHADAGAE